MPLVVTVASGAALAGNGLIGGATTNRWNPRTRCSPGVQTFDSSLTYNTGSTFDWELLGNTNAGRGTNFDGVNTTGLLTIGSSVNTTLRFNGSGSTVDWNNAFGAVTSLACFQIDAIPSVFDNNGNGNGNGYALHSCSVLATLISR